MLGIITELLFSWLLLHFIEKKNLSVLGFAPSKKRVVHFSIGFLLAAICCTSYHLLTTVFVHNNWVLNEKMSLTNFLNSMWWTLRSVLFEELLFRGALFYILIRKLGVQKASIVSAICFGISHWFMYNAFQPIQMIIIFFMTGMFGYVLALAFAKTKSLYLPIALHFGWNLLNIVVFSNGPLGQQLFMKQNGNHLDGIASLLVFLFQVFALPIAGYLYVTSMRETEIKAAIPDVQISS